jgi:hypothetical protein
VNTRSLFPALAAVLAHASTAPAQATRPASANADVPVAKVVLFSSGVGYFEHAGTVHGASSTELRFKTSQINDILKSVVLQDQDGGKIGAITYPSQDPLAKTLKSFQVDITQNPSLAQLLNQLRGAHVTIQAQAEHLSGTILGVETRQRASEKGDAAVPTLNLLTGATIRSVDLQSISNLSLDDPQLQDELTKALAALVQARDQDKKPVTINFSGTGDRRVRLGYVVETPVWKTSYRLLLEDRPMASKLQGWAIVENQTESDWNNVALSLVSGRPISFMMDLYQPLYATRPTVVPQMFAGLRPQVYESGIDASRERVEMRADESRKAQGSAAPAAQESRRMLGSAVAQLNEVVTTSAIDAASSYEAIAGASKLGELFQYTVPNVTLARQKSAMLPIIGDTVSIQRLSIYNADVLRRNPLNGVLLKNTSDKHLLQGPVTVLDKGEYAGDARIDDVGPGQERLLSYGIDLDMTVDNTKQASTNAITTATIRKGLLVLTRKLSYSVEYAADNKSDKDKMLVIEHQIRPGWHLVDTQSPMETTPTHYRFKGSAPANKISTLTVREEITQSETVAMVNATIDMLLVYNRNGEIPARVRDAIAKAARLRQAVADADRDINVRVQQINDITAEQNRIRENMKTVAPSTQYYERLLSKLNEQESSIEGLQRERAAITLKRDAARGELDDYLSNLTVG